MIIPENISLKNSDTKKNPGVNTFSPAMRLVLETAPRDVVRARLHDYRRCHCPVFPRDCPVQGYEPFYFYLDIHCCAYCIYCFEF